MTTDDGFYYCKKCKLYIEVMTTLRNRKNIKTWYRKVKIPFCPQCKGKIEGIGRKVYKDIKPKLYLNVNRSYDFPPRRGKQSINMDLKFT